MDCLPYGLKLLSITCYEKLIINLPPELIYISCKPINLEWHTLPESLQVIDFRNANSDDFCDKYFDDIGYARLNEKLKHIICRELQLWFLNETVKSLTEFRTRICMDSVMVKLLE